MPKLGEIIREKAEGVRYVEITVKEAKSQKSVAQNAFYHALLGLIIEQQGGNKMDFNKLRERLKIKLGYGYDVDLPDGTVNFKTHSMSHVTIKQSNIFIEEAINICNFLEIKYPERESFYKTIGLE